MTLIVSLPQQSFNDALFCLEEVQKLDKNKKPFEYWKYCIWSIISSTICMESYLTQYIYDRNKEVGEKQDFLKMNLNFPTKITYLQKKLGTKIPSYDSKDFYRIREARMIRNDIIHFRKYNIFNEITEQNAIETIEACRDLVKLILGGDGKDYNHDAQWINKTKSEKYDKD